MSKLNQPTTLRAEDFSDQSEWIARLFNILNPFIRSVQQVFDSNIDFSTNIRSVTRSFDVTSIQLPIRFSWPFTEARPAVLVIGSATAGTDATILLPAWTYDSSANELVISRIAEITATGIRTPIAGTNYKFSIRVTV